MANSCGNKVLVPFTTQTLQKRHKNSKKMHVGCRTPTTIRYLQSCQIANLLQGPWHVMMLTATVKYDSKLQHLQMSQARNDTNFACCFKRVVGQPAAASTRRSAGYKLAASTWWMQSHVVLGATTKRPAIVKSSGSLVICCFLLLSNRRHKTEQAAADEQATGVNRFLQMTPSAGETGFAASTSIELDL